MPGPIERYDAIQAEYKFVFLLYYRGSWCPFCRKHLKDLQELTPQINAAGGHVVAVTAEPESELSKMRSLSGYTGETIVDPENLLAKELKRRGLVDVAISERKGYPHDMAQPALLVGGPGVGGVLYNWAIVPAMMNFGGAKDRPVLQEVWDNAEAQMNGKSKVHAKINNVSFMSAIRQTVFS